MSGVGGLGWPNPKDEPQPAKRVLIPTEGSMYRAWEAFVDLYIDRAHEFPTFEEWILSNDPVCRAFRQGWAARSREIK